MSLAMSYDMNIKCVAPGADQVERNPNGHVRRVSRPTATSSTPHDLAIQNY